MRKVRILLLLIVLALAGGLSFYGLRSGWFAAHRGLDRQPTAQAPSIGTPVDQKTGEDRPTFDIVRAEPDGSIIMAGQSKPGWTVIVETEEKEIGRATADENGEWVIEPKENLPKGEYSLELSAKSPEGETTLFSRQRLALSLSDPKEGQPLIALTEEGKATRVLQMPPSKRETSVASAAESTELASLEAQHAAGETAGAKSPAANLESADQAENQISFASVDYEEAGEKSMLHLNGQASPDARVAVYVNNELAGTATSDATGSWSFSGNRQLDGGKHTLRADLIGKQGESVVARAEVNFERQPPVVTALADDGSKTDNLYGDKAVSDEEDQKADTKLAGIATAGEQSDPEQEDSGVVVVKRGDTLWHIARKHYGDGTKYTQIFRNNKGQIRNPNWIYPNQRFKLP
jgi:nucleoid-associated protein YgaU